MTETVSVKYKLQDEHGDVIKDEDGKVSYQEAEVTYTFPETLADAVTLSGEDVVYSMYKVSARSALQNVIRTKLKAGISLAELQEVASSWSPGMIMPRTTVNPENAIKNAFTTWSPEKQAEFLAELGVQV